jgi:hypothetical protein
MNAKHSFQQLNIYGRILKRKLSTTVRIDEKRYFVMTVCRVFFGYLKICLYLPSNSESMCSPEIDNIETMSQIPFWFSAGTTALWEWYQEHWIANLINARIQNSYILMPCTICYSIITEFRFFFKLNK